VTKRACVIGFPVAHSRSPLIHGYWLREHKIDGDYTRHEVKPEDIDNFLATFAGGPFVGCNVTLPHKEAAARHLAAATQVVRTLGVANTLWLEDGKLHGDNTDVEGFLSHLDDSIPGWSTRMKHALVIGAGGAARSIVYGLHARGVETITIANRSLERAAQLAQEVKIRANVISLGELEPQLSSVDLLVNTTSLGMKGQPPLDIDLKNLKRSAAVSDIVYVPLETSLLRQARERGHAVVDGLGMLLHQAVPGFERWFGVRPSVTRELRNLIVSDLDKDARK